jgi:lauroyl/myristoyl acyltransferase
MRARAEVRPYQRFATTMTAATIAPLIPPRFDPELTAVVSRINLAVLPQRRRRVAAKMAEHLGPDDHRDTAADATDYWRQRVETRWGQARGISLTGWKPTVEITGLDHLVEAKARGRGTILWRVSSHTAIPLNQALADHGFPVTHLSKHNHLLFSRDNRLWRFLSPSMGRILRKGEVEPLQERIEYGTGGGVAATRRLMAALNDNRVVTIVGDLATGRKLHKVNVNHETMRLANGGARLATSTGAALLPVTLSRTGPLCYRVDILEPLTAPDDAGADEAVISLIEQFAVILAEFIRREPSQWSKWRGPSS